MKYPILFLLVLPFAPSAFAEEVSLCTSLDKLKSARPSCAQNSLFADAAAACSRGLDRAIAAEQAKLTLIFGARGVVGAKAQNVNFQNHGANLAAVSANLRWLGETARRAQAEMQAYTAGFSLPGGLTEAKAEELGLLGFFSGFPCYQRNVAALGKEVNAIGAKVEELERTHRATQRLLADNEAAGKAVTALGETEHPALENMRLPASRLDLPAAPSPAAAPPPGQSGISGTKEAEE